jgi:hypothetical protein
MRSGAMREVKLMSGETASSPYDTPAWAVPAEPENTGDERVDAAVAGLASLRDRPVAEHPEVFETVHQGLQDALEDPDQENEDRT